MPYGARSGLFGNLGSFQTPLRPPSLSDGIFTTTYTETPSVTTTTRLPMALEGFIVVAEMLLLAYPWNLTVKAACLAQKPFSWYLSWGKHMR
jgi:hypothetical protein